MRRISRKDGVAVLRAVRQCGITFSTTRAAQELGGSLRRMGFDHIDLVYAAEPPERLVAHIRAHRRRKGARVGCAELAARAAHGSRRPRGRAAGRCTGARQARAARARCCGGRARHGDCVDALWFGALSGRRGRRTRTDDRRSQPASVAAAELVSLGAEVEATPAQLALAFCLADDRVGSVLFGASKPEQVRENAGALDVLARLSEDQLERLRMVGA